MQTAENRGNQAKQLCHLTWTEEQCLYACQTCYTNQTTCISGRLMAVSVTHLDDTITQHDNKTMEVAYLEEAQAHFTQANDMPFLQPPLPNTLGLLSCNDPPFEVIATSHYQPLAGTNQGALLLLQHLKWPPKVPDCDLTLTETMHRDSWKKTKECLCLASAHFGLQGWHS